MLHAEENNIKSHRGDRIALAQFESHSEVLLAARTMYRKACRSVLADTVRILYSRKNVLRTLHVKF